MKAKIKDNIYSIIEERKRKEVKKEVGLAMIAANNHYGGFGPGTVTN